MNFIYNDQNSLKSPNMDAMRYDPLNIVAA